MKSYGKTRDRKILAAQMSLLKPKIPTCRKRKRGPWADRMLAILGQIYEVDKLNDVFSGDERVQLMFGYDGHDMG